MTIYRITDTLIDDVGRQVAVHECITFGPDRYVGTATFNIPTADGRGVVSAPQNFIIPATSPGEAFEGFDAAVKNRLEEIQAGINKQRNGIVVPTNGANMPVLHGGFNGR